MRAIIKPTEYVNWASFCWQIIYGMKINGLFENQWSLPFQQNNHHFWEHIFSVNTG